MNKCKTELQFWRSKSHIVLGGTAASGSGLGAAAACQACVGGVGIAPEGGLPDSGLTENDAASSAAESAAAVASASESSSEALSADLKALANQGVFPDLGAPSFSPSLDNAEEPDQGRARGCRRRLLIMIALIWCRSSMAYFSRTLFVKYRATHQVGENLQLTLILVLV